VLRNDLLEGKRSGCRIARSAPPATPNGQFRKNMSRLFFPGMKRFPFSILFSTPCPPPGQTPRATSGELNIRIQSRLTAVLCFLLGQTADLAACTGTTHKNPLTSGKPSITKRFTNCTQTMWQIMHHPILATKVVSRFEQSPASPAQRQTTKERPRAQTKASLDST